MVYLKAIAIADESRIPAGFPFDLPAVESLDELAFQSPVTFLVGDNGSGKSTIMEAIACGMKCPTVGRSDVTRDPSLAHARALASQLRFIKTKNPRKRLFFRSEDAIGFTRRVNQDMADLKEMEAHYKVEQLADHISYVSLAALGLGPSLAANRNDAPTGRQTTAPETDSMITADRRNQRGEAQ